MELKELLNISNSTYGLVSSDAMNTALEAIAETDITTAKYAIRNHLEYASPEDALKAALGDLTHAHFALHKKWSSALGQVNGVFMRPIELQTDAYVCCLISILHYALGNNRKLSIDALDWASNALEEITGPIDIMQIPGLFVGVMKSFTDVVNPFTWSKVIKNKLSDTEIAIFIIEMKELL